jgi:hypothetical protein
MMQHMTALNLSPSEFGELLFALNYWFETSRSGLHPDRPVLDYLARSWAMP